MTTNRVHQFLSPRGGSNYWSQRSDLVEAWKQGSQLSVPPLTTEWACILDCNARCPLCPYHKAQLQHCDGMVPVGELAVVNEKTTPSMRMARLVLERSREAGISGVLFTGGGEPLIWPPLVDALRYSHELGMDNGIYTNGFLLGSDPHMSTRLMDRRNGLVFVRLSINAVSPAAVSQHWGLKDPAVIDYQFIGLRRLLEARNELAQQSGGSDIPSIQISTIVDKHTVNDLDAICEKVADIFRDARTKKGPEDVIVVRALTIHGRKRYSHHDHEDWVIRRILEVCGQGGSGRARLKRADVPLFLGFGLDRVETGDVQSYDELIEAEYAQRGVAMANGVFLTVAPDATVFISTEHNCGTPEFAIGNLETQSVREIYGSVRRQRLLDRMNEQCWGPGVSQPTPRTARLDRIARAIHRGELDDSDLEAIRRASLSSHSLLLD